MQLQSAPTQDMPVDPETDQIASWEALAATAGELPTQDAPWALASFDAFGGSRQIFDVEEGGSLRALTPMARQASVLEYAGARGLGEPVDLLADSPESLGSLAAALAETGAPLVIERLPADSPTIAALREAYGPKARILEAEKPDFPTIALEESWQEPGGGLSSSRRSALRRSRKKLEALGEVTVELLAPKPEEVSELLQDALLIESRSWKGEEGTAIAFVAPIANFTHRYAEELAARGSLRVDFLRVGERRVAMQIGLVWRNRHWLFKIGYDAAYAAGSPGQVLLGEGVAAAAREGLETYELMGSRADWTDAWTKDVRSTVKLSVLPAGVRGRVGSAVAAARVKEERLRGIARSRRNRVGNRIRNKYVVGKTTAEALAAESRCREAGYETVVGFANGVTESPQEVREEWIALAEGLPAGSEVALKLPAGAYGGVDEVLEICLRRDLTLHIDAIGLSDAERTKETALRLIETAPGRVGCTLPGRWLRSTADAEELRDKEIRVRVVKGEVEAHSEDEETDLAEGFVEVAERLAGGSAHVELATQDAATARRAAAVLAAAGTSHELQVLLGMHVKPTVRLGRELGTPVRVYVPYGVGRLPYSRNEILRSPARLASLARDLLGSGPRRPPGA